MSLGEKLPTAMDVAHTNHNEWEERVSLSTSNYPMCRFWLRYLSYFRETNRPSDGNVANWILETMFHEDALKLLLDAVTPGRRVFHQMCRQSKLPFQLHFTLIKVGEVDLAFRVALSKDVWDYVVPLYSDLLVTHRSRLLALSKAVHQMNWKEVQAMGAAATDQGSQSHRAVQRKAFRQLVRHSQLRLALDLIHPAAAPGRTPEPGPRPTPEPGPRRTPERGPRPTPEPGPRRTPEPGPRPLRTLGAAVRDGDLDMAISACVRHNHCATATEFLLYMARPPRWKLWKQLVPLCLQAGMVDRLLRVIRRWDYFVHFSKFCKFLIQEALKTGCTSFVEQFCGLSPWKWRLAVKVTTQLNMWPTLQALVGHKYSRIDYGVLRTCLRKLSDVKTNDEGQRTLSDFLEKSADRILGLCGDLDDLLLDMDPSDQQQRRGMSEWCLTRGYPHLAFLFSLAEGNSHTCRQVLEQKGAALHKELLREAGMKIIDLRDIHTLIAWMLIIQEGDSENLDLFLSFPEDFDWHFDFDDTFVHFSSEDLLEACRTNQLRGCCVSLAIARQDWEIVENELASFPSQKLIEYAIVEAAINSQWSFVENFLPQCSHNQSILAELIESAMTDGEVHLAKLIFYMKRVDPCLIVDYRHVTLLFMAVSTDDASVCEDLVRWCISTGVSTYELSSHNCQGVTYPCPDGRRSSYLRPMRSCGALREAFRHGQLPLVDLLYESGATSNGELHGLKGDSELRRIHERTGATDLLNFVDSKASTPRDLQGLCRLRVSHLIGCRPGRETRVASLPLPDIVKDLVLFKDLCPS